MFKYFDDLAGDLDGGQETRSRGTREADEDFARSRRPIAGR